MAEVLADTPDDAQPAEFGNLAGAQERFNYSAYKTIVGAGTSMLALFPFQAFIVKFMPDAYDAIPNLFHKIVSRSFGVRRNVRGKRTRAQGTLFVANHISWLDIPVLGSVVPGSFVAKSEIGGWGLFGTLSRFQRTIFVQRERRHKSAEQRNEIVERLAAGHNVILFPEGTSSAGNGVLPFKSALFSVAEAAQKEGLTPQIQPISLAYTRLNYMPLIRANRHRVAWVGDMEFLPHLKHVMRLNHIQADITFHQPIHLEDFGGRKALAQHCEHVVGQGVRLANSGRLG